MTVEVANYNMRHVFAFKWREQELFSWWFVHGMYHYIWKLHCNELNIILFTDRNYINLQTISNKNRASMFVVQLLVPYQECLAFLDLWLCGFLDLWLCGFLGDIDSGNVYPYTTLIVWMLY